MKKVFEIIKTLSNELPGITSRLLSSALVLILVAAMLLNFTGAALAVNYNIAVVQVWDSGQWAADEFGQLDAAPGVETYSWAFLPSTSLTTSGLAPYNVLIIPESHDYSWLDATGKAAIVAWVNSGNKLIVHNFGNATALADDPLMAAFGANYRIDWTGEMGEFNADSVKIADATHTLLTTPNAITTSAISNWMTTIHNSINPDTSGSAWRWALDSVQTNNHWWGSATSGSGSIIVLGGDPELHAPGYAAPADKSIPRKLIENEIVFTAPQTSYTLTVNIVGQGTVIKNPNQATYNAGTPVQLTANAASGWTFSGWSGGLSGATNPATINMDTNKTVTATFTIPSPTGGVSFWRFDEASGTTAIDSWDGNNGTLAGATPPARTTGRVGGGLRFGAASNRVEVPDSANLRIIGPITIEAWISFNSIAQRYGFPPGWENAPIAAKWTGSGGSGVASYALAMREDAIPFFDLSPDGVNVSFLPAIAPIPLNTFTHLAGVWNGTHMQLFVNGVLVNSLPYAGPIYASNVPFHIGGFDPSLSNGVTDTIDGVIDEVKIYNRALSAQELMQEYQSGGGPPPPSPVPGVTDYGLGIMAGLFVVAAYFGLRRMRRATN